MNIMLTKNNDSSSNGSNHYVVIKKSTNYRDIQVFANTYVLCFFCRYIQWHFQNIDINNIVSDHEIILSIIR